MGLLVVWAHEHVVGDDCGDVDGVHVDFGEQPTNKINTIKSLSGTTERKSEKWVNNQT